MPLISSIDHGHLGQTYLWWIKEEQQYYVDELQVAGIDLSVIDGWHPKRQREWLSGRNLIHTFIDDPITKMVISNQGKPYFDNAKLHFSLSHSGSTVAITKSHCSVGLDVQLHNPKMDRMAHKFVNTEELDVLPKDWSIAQKQHYIWCAKEAMFKAYGEGEVDFRKNLFIKASSATLQTGDLKGQLKKGDTHLEYIIRYRKHGQLHICHAWEV